VIGGPDSKCPDVWSSAVCCTVIPFYVVVAIPDGGSYLPKHVVVSVMSE